MKENVGDLLDENNKILSINRYEVFKRFYSNLYLKKENVAISSW